MGEDKSEVLQGTPDLMVLKIVETMGPLHGCAADPAVMMLFS